MQEISRNEERANRQASEIEYEKLKDSQISYQEVAVPRCYAKKVFLEICKIHRKTPVPESLF